MSCNVMLSDITFLMIFCGFWSIAFNTVDKLQFLVYIIVINDVDGDDDIDDADDDNFFVTRLLSDKLPRL